MAKITAAEMTERWFQAQRIIAQHEQAINNNYDKTIIGTIIDHSKREQGIYTVLYNDTIELIAMSDNKTYRKDDQVYITVPQGDFKQNKIIIGKRIPNENQPLAFISPLESYVSLTDDIDFTSAKSILANGENRFQEIAVIDFSDPQYSDFKNNADYNNIGLSAKFKCHFNNSIMTSGRYGIQLDITGILKDSENTEMTFERNQYALMSDVDMFGDPYKFNTFFTQSKMIDIRNIGQISKIVIYLYQDKNFKYYDGETSRDFPVEETYAYHNQKGELQTEVKPLNDNIFVSDISLSFGNNVIDIEDNSVKIYTLDHLTFDKDKVENDKKYNDKDIYLIWYNKDDALQFIGFSDGVVDKDDAGNVIPYDEDAYQQEKASQMAGASVTIAKSDGNIPKIKECLQIYKNAKQFNDYFQDLFDAIDLYIPQLFDDQVNGIRGFFFKEYYNQLNEHDAYKSAVDIMNTIYCRQENLDTGHLINYIYPAISKVANLNPTSPDYNVEDLSLLELYIKGLQYYGEIYDALKENKEADISSSEVSAAQYFNTAYNNYNAKNSQNDFRDIIKNHLESPMTDLRTQLELIYDDFPEMREDLKIVLSFFDQVVVRYTKILEKLDKLNIAQADQVKSLQERFTKKPITDQALLGFQEEYDAFLEANKNRYCVYWYRYNLGYEDNNDKYLPKNWKRLTSEEITNSYGEIAGMPELDHTGEKFAPKSGISLQITLDHYDRTTEKFKAVVIFNHNHYFSNELVFSNENPNVAIGLNNIIYIKLGANSRDAYPLYNNNYELTPADRNIIRELSVHYNNTDGDDTPLIGSYVYWYIPKGGSLLIPPGGQYGHNDYLEGQKGFTYLNKNDELLQKHHQFYRDDCECYFKPIGEKKRTNDDGTVDYIVNESDLSFYYMIANTYTASAMNNKIVCQVVKENVAYEDDQSFTFGQSGTSGTQYTLQIDITADQKYHALKNGDTLEVQGRFFDYDHRELIGDECPILTWRWADGMPRKGLAIKDNDKGINYKYIKGNLNPDTQCLYNVLECIATWDKIAKKESSGEIIYADEPLTLRKFLPIPYVGDTGEYYADCPTRIIYTQFGNEPIMDCNKPLQLYDKITNQVVDNVIWEMYYYLQDPLNPERAARDQDSELLDANLRFLPKVEERVSKDNSEKKEYYITVLNMYIDRLTHYPVIVARKAGLGILWAQPLYITYGKNGSDLLNNWDESLVIDETNGTILSTMVGAGFKDSDNTFHGVLMGDVRSAFPNEPIQPDGIGIYGFHRDMPSFGFKIDGTGFIGKPGGGRIVFDGNEGLIGSAKRLYTLNQKNSEQPNVVEEGMLLNFERGVIDILGPPNGTKQSQVLIQEKNPYFTIKSNDGNILMYVGSKTSNEEEADYYLQSNDFSTNYNLDEGIVPSGVKFDLKNGKLTGYDFDFQAIDPITRSEVRMSSDGSPYFQILQRNFVNNEWKNLDLITISKEKFMMHSSNWNDDERKGTQFDLNNGNITSYGFDLAGYAIKKDAQQNDQLCFIKLSSDPRKLPLNINDNFTVNWDGSFTALKGNIGGWVVDGTTGSLISKVGDVVLSPTSGLSQTSKDMHFVIDGTARLANLTVKNSAVFDCKIQANKGISVEGGIAVKSGGITHDGIDCVPPSSGYSGTVEIRYDPGIGGWIKVATFEFTRGWCTSAY